MNKTILGIIVVVVMGLGGWYYVNSNKGSYTQQVKNPEVNQAVGGPQASSATSTENTATTKIFTMADVATHNSEISCYAIVRGEVYDLTTWVSKHPGGPDKILNICGKDGTVGFEKKHGGKEKPENTLTTFKIGVLAQ